MKTLNKKCGIIFKKTYDQIVAEYGIKWSKLSNTINKLMTWENDIKLKKEKSILNQLRNNIFKKIL